MTLFGKMFPAAAIGLLATLVVTPTVLGEHTRASARSDATEVRQKGTVAVAVSTLATENFVPRMNAGGELPVDFAWGEPLIIMDRGYRSLRPNIATNWTLKRVGSKWVWHFKMRQGVRFNEGKGPVTARDVQFTFSQCLLPDTINNGCPILKSAIDNDIKNFRIINPYEFKLYSEVAVPALPTFLSNGSTKAFPILPSAYYSRVGDSGFAAHPIGAGPFIFKSQVRGQSVTLEAVRKHFRATPSFETLKFIIAPEAATRLAMLRSGAAQIAVLDVPQLPQIQAARLKPIVIHNTGNLYFNLGGQFYDMPEKNCPSCPWVGSSRNALRVREALSLAIDRRALRRALFLGSGQLSAVPFSWTPGPYAYNDRKWKPPAYNPARAKSLLAQAGLQSGLTIRVPLVTGFPLLPNIYDVAEAVASYWEAIGITVKRVAVPWTSFRSSALVNRNTAGLAFPTVTAKTDDPLTDLERNFSRTGAATYLDNQEFDRVIDQAKNLVDPRKRAALSRKLGAYIIKERLGIPLLSLNTILAATPKVRYTPMAGNVLFGTFEYVKLK